MTTIQSWNKSRTFKSVSRWLNVYSIKSGERRCKFQGKSYTIYRLSFPVVIGEDGGISNNELCGYIKTNNGTLLYVEFLNNRVKLYEEV